MKCFKNILLSFLVMFLFIINIQTQSVVFAKNSTDAIDYRVNIEAIIKDFVGDETRQNRFACSENEYNSALYIAEKMSSYGFSPVNNQSTKNGLQKFDVTTAEGLYISNNVVFKKQGTSSEKKVILATHYDSKYVLNYSDEDETIIKEASEGVSDSGAGVGLLLLVSQLLSYETLPFDIEVVFFGSHYQNLAGSAYYTSFISNEEAKDILLMVNFDTLIGDGSVYLYNGEFSNSSDSYVYNAFSKNINIKKASDYSIVSDTLTNSVTGLDYTNFALESDNANFIRVGVKTLSPLVISDNCVNSLGVINYKPIVSVLEDNITKINDITKGKYLNNLSLIVNGCMNLLTDNHFASNISEVSTSNMYSILGNEKMMVFIAFILLIVIIFVYIVIKQHLEKQALEARESLQIDRVIATISPKDLEDMDALMDRLSSQIEESVKKETENKDKDDKLNKNNENLEKDNKQEDK